MAGIYIHIPFCKQKCSYCNFHFSTQLTGMSEMQEALLLEIRERAEEIRMASVRTIYFGGGTPSLWPVRDLNALIEAIGEYTSLEQVEEITLEANPDDLQQDYVSDLKNHTPVTRLSIGIQSFREEDLRLMNRAHNAAEARTALDTVFRAGFREITTDLIFGLPGSDIGRWLWQLKQITEYPVYHLSCYNLTIEDKTALKYQLRKGLITLPDDEIMIEQFHGGADFLADRGFTHYEISNYGKPGHFAVHNTSYWQNEPYIGIGPSAHSYDGFRRRWNISHNINYIKALTTGGVFWEDEELSEADRYNEYLLTGLRTMWGVQDDRILEFSAKFQKNFREVLDVEVRKGNIRSAEGRHTLTRQGRALADHVISEFFYV